MLRWLAYALIVGGLWGAAAAPVHAQPDSIRTEILRRKGFAPDHSPQGALWRALAVPSWGQYYNRQYYKMPFVYAGLGGLGYSIVRMNQQYVLYRHAHLYKIETERTPDAPNPYANFEDAYNKITADLGGQVSARVLRRQRDKYRRWRDLSVVGSVIFYGLTVLDAYVSAHLLTFDVGTVEARVLPTPHGAAATFSIRF
ncbi:DUF5683 domain-containing protein [Salisaeta longa]|uniref:DUF5683 domain-containing protein n=1 Tax=Salisaeta longa TaxID=503170 RepID=UPI0004179D02|nr:DUF5683 domain-containing protein [Salisaeta longa]